MGFAPFRDGDTYSAFQSHIAKLTQEIRGLENSYVLRTSQTELEQFYLDKAHIEPLTLHVDDYHIEDERSVQVECAPGPKPSVFPRRQALSHPRNSTGHRHPVRG